MSPQSPRSLRKDAAENAERLLSAAIRAGVNEGRQVPLAQIARDAGVGVGTLYRRYPDRDALIQALQVRAYRLLIAIVEAASENAPTGLAAIAAFLENSFAERDQLVLPLHGVPLLPDSEAGALRDRMEELMTAMVERGHTDGTVRPDVDAWTVVQFGALLAQPMTTTAGWDRTADQQRVVFLRGISSLTPPVAE